MRVVTRGDMDGLTGSVIVARHRTVDAIKLIHPQDITNRRVDILADDVLINVPYHPRCAMWFDHHQHTATYEEPPAHFEGSYGLAPSAARLVYEYFGGAEAMPDLEELVLETDRMDSAALVREDVLDPQRYILLGFTIDSRTGIGAFEDYFLSLHDLLRRSTPIEEILESSVVRRRCELMESDESRFRAALKEHSRVDGNVVVTDFRPLDPAPVGNRFVVYALYPEVNVSVRVHWGPDRRFVVAVVGHSIFDRSCKTDVGELAARYGGGGHEGAGSIPIDVESADETVAAIVNELKKNG